MSKSSKSQSTPETPHRTTAATPLRDDSDSTERRRTKEKATTEEEQLRLVKQVAEMTLSASGKVEIL